MVDLEPGDKSTLLHARHADDGAIEVHERAGLRWLTIGGHSVQSACRIGAADELALPHLNFMLVGAALCRQPPRILNLGFGGGAFERFVAARWPAATIDSVEISAAVLAVTQQFFELPESLAVTISSAEHFLEKTATTYDLVLCDVFAGEAHPPCLAEQNFYAQLARHLAPDGVVALNLMPGSERALLELLLVIRPQFTSIALATVPNHANVVALLRQQAPSTAYFETQVRALGTALGLDLSSQHQAFQQIPPR